MKCNHAEEIAALKAERETLIDRVRKSELAVVEYVTKADVLTEQFTAMEMIIESLRAELAEAGGPREMQGTIRVINPDEEGGINVK